MTSSPKCVCGHPDEPNHHTYHGGCEGDAQGRCMCFEFRPEPDCLCGCPASTHTKGSYRACVLDWTGCMCDNYEPRIPRG